VENPFFCPIVITGTRKQKIKIKEEYFMRKQNFYKAAAITILSGTMMAGLAMTSYAAGWQRDGTGWWYGTNDGNTTWYYNGWQWIDGNNDGITECYYFDQSGYLLMNTTTPDGYAVNADGAWVENGVVQTKLPSEQANDTFVNTYNAQGVSNIALEMVENTREENAKFGEVEVSGEDAERLNVKYANGFRVFYPRVGGWQTIIPPIDNRKLLFKYHDASLSSGKAVESYLYGLGVGFKGGYGGTYSTGGACRIKLDDGHTMCWGSDGFMELRKLQRY